MQHINVDGSFFAISTLLSPVADGGGHIEIFDTSSGERTVQLAVPRLAGALRFDPATENLIAGFSGGRIATIDLRTGEILNDITVQGVGGGTLGEIFDIGTRRDGMLIVVARSSILVVDPDTGVAAVAADLQRLADGWIRPDGLVVILEAADRVDLFDTETSALVDRTWDVDDEAHVAFHDGLAAVADPVAGTVEVIDLSTGAGSGVDIVPEGTSLEVIVALPEPDGAWLISRDHTLARAENGRIVDELRLGSVDGVVGIPFESAQDGNRFGDLLGVLGRRSDGTEEATLIRLERGRPARLVTVEVRDALTVHPSAAGGLHVVDAAGVVSTYGADGSLLGRTETGEADIFIAALDPSGTRLALASDDDLVYLVGLDSGAVDEIRGAGIVVNMGFDGEGRTLALAAADGTVRLWNVDRKESAGTVWNGAGRTFESEAGWYDATTSSLWMSAGGRLLRIPLDPARWVERACGIVGRDLTAEEWERFVPGDQPLRPTCS